MSMSRVFFIEEARKTSANLDDLIAKRNALEPKRQLDLENEKKLTVLDDEIRAQKTILEVRKIQIGLSEFEMVKFLEELDEKSEQETTSEEVEQGSLNSDTE